METGHTSVVVPPAASIFSFAEPENALALTWTATDRSPFHETRGTAPSRCRRPTDPAYGIRVCPEAPGSAMLGP